MKISQVQQRKNVWEKAQFNEELVQNQTKTQYLSDPKEICSAALAGELKMLLKHFLFFFIYSILHSFDNFFIVKRNIPVKIPKILLYGHTSKTLALNCHHSPHHPPPGPIRFPHTAARTQPSVKRATRDDQTSRPSSASNIRTHRRAPQSSSGPRQPERPVAGMSLLDRRRQRHTKPQSDQRNRNTPKLSKRNHKSLSDKEI